MLDRALYWLRTWVIDHWYGRLSLAESFWINMVFVNLGAGIVLRRVTLSLAGSFFVIAVTAAISIWQLVGLWRSSLRNRRKQPIWSGILMGICILNVVFVLGIFLAVVFGGQEILQGQEQGQGIDQGQDIDKGHDIDQGQGIDQGQDIDKGV